MARQNQLLKQREEELKAQNKRFDAAMRYMSQGLCLFDAEQRVVIANDRYAEIYGLTPEQVKPGTTLPQILEARAANGVYNNIDAEEFVDDGRCRLRRGGVRRSCGWPTAASSRSCAGRCPTAAWSARTRMSPSAKISARSWRSRTSCCSCVRRRCKEQNERFDAALKNMSQGLCLFDAEQRVVIANHRYADIYGLTPDQVKPGTTLRQIVEARIAKGFYAGANPEDTSRSAWPPSTTLRPRCSA